MDSVGCGKSDCGTGGVQKGRFKPLDGNSVSLTLPLHSEVLVSPSDNSEWPIVWGLERCPYGIVPHKNVRTGVEGLAVKDSALVAVAHWWCLYLLHGSLQLSNISDWI